MTTKYACLLIIIVLLFGCDEKVVYKDDPGQNYGVIAGKLLQSDAKAWVYVNQEITVDSTEVNIEDGTFRIENLPIGNYDIFIHSEKFRTYARYNVIVEGAGISYIGEIDLSTVPDLVASHYPADLDEIVFSGQGSRLSISIMFTQPMDRKSVEEAFSTQPPSEGVFNWGNYVYVPIYDNNRTDDAAGSGGATITTFSKITAFTYFLAQKDSFTDTTYKVMLSTAAQDTAGNHLRFPLEYSFSTVQSASSIDGIQSIPSHGDIDVPLISTNGIQLTFPRNMDEKSTEASITMTPDVERIYLWPAKNQLTIYNGGPYRAETTYNITVGSSAKDLDGVSLDEPYTLSFTTDEVKITQTTPRNGELYVSYSDPRITLWFNTYMSKTSIENAFSISPTVSGKFNWGTKNNSYNNTSITFNPGESLLPNTKYTVTIKRDAMDLYETEMNDDYTFSFVTRPK